MKIEIPKDELVSLISRQLNSFFPFSFDITPYLDEVILRMEKNFSSISNKYYNNNGETYFSPYHSCQYLYFLYTLSNTLYKHNIPANVCSQIYYLNKIMHSIDLYYEIELPEFWFCDHPLGTVLGRAKYKNYFSFIQGCTVGQNHGIYPEFEEYVAMYAHSSVIGNSHIGRKVVIGANTHIKDENIPDNCVVFGSSPNLIIKQHTEQEQDTIFHQIWNK